MSNINELILYETLFRGRSQENKLRPSELAYFSVHGKMPIKKTIINGSLEHKLYNYNLVDSNLKEEWLDKIYNSNILPKKIECSGGSDSNNLAFIAFSSPLTPKLQKLLNELSKIKHTYIHIDKTSFLTPKIIIASDLYYSESKYDNYKWEQWWDEISDVIANN